MFALGWRRLRRRRRQSVRAGQAGWYAAGIGAVVLALFSPIDQWAHASFPAHMVQHLLLIKVAAPALLLANPFAAMLWALPRSLRAGVGGALGRGSLVRRFGSALTRPPIAWSVYLCTLWLWRLSTRADLTRLIRRAPSGICAAAVRSTR